MKIKKLFSNIEAKIIGPDVEISGLTANSKAVQSGDLFIAKKGERFDGCAFIDEAIRAGAQAIVTDLYNPFLKGITQVVLPYYPLLEHHLAEKFYQNPSKHLWVAGVTGTNGKTTVAYMIYHLLENLDKGGAALISTIEQIIGERHVPSTMTTPDLLTVQRLLFDVCRAKKESVVMEATSHALDQGRLLGIDFDVAIFTNLTDEHLDYHETMEKYAKAKSKLFTSLGANSLALLNKDCPYAAFMKPSCSTWSYSLHPGADLSAWIQHSCIQGTECTIDFQGKKTSFFLPFIGHYNVQNFLAAAGALLWKGITIEALQKQAAKLPAVPGRLERIKGAPFDIIVDFAHNPGALESLLLLLRPLTPGRLVLVFGCGGERDRLKRPKMGSIAEKYADLIFLTSDNSRSEDPSKIIAEIAQGVVQKEKMRQIVSRREAIYAALNDCLPGDTLVIAGRGHESTLHEGHFKQPFNDASVIRELCSPENLFRK